MPVQRIHRRPLVVLLTISLLTSLMATVTLAATARTALAQTTCALVHEPADFTIDSVSDLTTTGSGSGTFTLPDGTTTGTWDISHTFPVATNSTETGYVNQASVGGDGRLALGYSGPAGAGVTWDMEAVLNVTVNDPSVDYYLVWFGSSNAYNPASLFSDYVVEWTPATSAGTFFDPADQTDQTDGAVFNSGDTFAQTEGGAAGISNNDIEWHVATPVNTNSFTVNPSGGKTGEAFGFAITQLIWNDACVPPTALGSTVDLAIDAGHDFDITALATDSDGDLVLSTLRLIDPDDGSLVTSVTIAGEGVWSADTTTGEVTFTPESGFDGESSVDYQVGDTQELTSNTATLSVNYLPVATDDSTADNAVGATVTIDPLANDVGDLVETTVALVDPSDGSSVTSLTVAGEGTWTVDGTTGEISFAPAAGFEGDPTPVDYTVEDGNGDEVQATISHNYLPEAVDDTSTGNDVGTAVTVDPLANDIGNLDETTVALVDPSDGSSVTSLTVAGEGTWTVDGTTGEITFTPLATFFGSPTPVDYTVETDDGDQAQAQVSISYLGSPAVSLEKNAPTGTLEPGGTLTYTFTVTNDGDVPLSNVSIDDPLIAAVTCDDTTIAVSASTNCSGTMTVTQAQFDAGSITNTATVTATGAGQDVEATDSVTTTTRTEWTSAMTVDKSMTANADEDNSSDVSLDDTLTYTITVTNTGNVTLSNISVADPTAGNPTCPNTSLAPDASMDCTVDYTVDQDDVDAGEILNTATASAEDPDGSGLTQTGSHTESVTRSAAMTLDKEASATIAAAGQTINYTITVTNTGNVTLTGISVDDPLTGDESCPRTTLAPATSMECTASYEVTQDDVDNGGVDNTATASATEPDGAADGVTATGSANVPAAAAAPAVDVGKAMSDNADEDASGDVSLDDTLTYTITVTNIGNVTLSNISVADPTAGDPTCPATSLAPGASMDCTVDYTVDQDDIDAGQIVNTATATVTIPGGTRLTGTATETTDTATRAGALSLTKSSTATDVAVGDVVTYSFVVENDGNVTISDIELDDPLTDDESCPQTTLAPGAEMSCSATYTVTQADIDRGSITNTATARGTEPDGTPLAVTAEGSVTITTETAEGTSSLDKEITANADEDGSGDVSLGDTLTYTITVANTGNVTLTEIEVTDPKAGAPSCPETTLGPDESMECTIDYVVTQADVDAGEIVNEATVSAKLPGGTETTTTGTNQQGITRSASISVVKAASPGDLRVGTVVDYTITVTNTGNVTLSDVALDDPLTEDETCPTDTLDPAEAMTCTASYTIDQDDVNAGMFDNTATAIATQPDGVPGEITDSSTASFPVEQTPSISLVKTVGDNADEDGSGDVSVGDTLTYNFVAENTGNVTLFDLAIDDPKAGTPTCPGTVIIPDASVTCTVDYTVTQDDIDAGEIVNEATASVVGPLDQNVTDTGTNTITITQTPDVEVNKSAPVGDLTVGSTVVYTITVTNTGDVTMTDVEVSDPMADSVSCDVTASLAPGEMAVCTAEVVITQDHIDSGSIENTATVEIQPPTGPTITTTGTNKTDVDQNPEVELVKSDPVGDLTLGSKIVYTITATNVGDVTVTDLVVDDPMADSISCDITDELAPGEVATCTAEVTVTQNHIDDGVIDNTATISIQPPTGPVITTTGTNKTEIEQEGSVEVVKSDPVGDLTVGSTIVYTITATNTGNVTVFDIDVTDPLADSVTCDVTSSLAPGEVSTCTAEVTVTQDHIDDGEINNTATSEVTLPTGTKITTTGTNKTEIEQISDLEFEKSAPVGELIPGNTVIYTITATNTGNVTLSELEIADPLADSMTCDVVDSLAPGQVATCTAKVIVTQDHLDAGGINNTATVTVVPPIGPAITKTGVNETKIEQEGDVEVVKAKPVGELIVGNTIVYTITVTNTGNVTVFEVLVDDPMADSVTCDVVDMLAPGEVATCTAKVVVTQAHVDEGSIKNLATAKVTLPGGEEIVKEGRRTTKIDQVGDVEVVKAKPVGDLVVGNTITYTITVTNIGNVTVSDVVVTDPMADQVTCEGAESVAPGATATCTAEVVVTQSHVDAGGIDNTATSTVTLPNGNKVTKTGNRKTSITQNGSVAVDKSEPAGELVVGNTIVYTITVTNTGNVTVSDIDVSDPMADTVDCDVRDSLAPGSTATCTAEVVVTQDHVDAGGIDNTARATVSLPDGTKIHKEGNRQTSIDGSGDISVSKTYVEGDLKVGEEVIFEIVVTNTGTTTVTEYTAADPLAESITCDRDRIAPGEAAVCRAVYVVTQTDIDRGAIYNPAHVVAKTPVGEVEVEIVSKTATESFASMEMTKVAEIVGDSIVYTVSVENTGTVTLRDVVIDDPMLSDQPLCEIAAIAPSSSEGCSGTYEITKAAYDEGTVTNTAGAKAETPQGEELTDKITITTRVSPGQGDDDLGSGERGAPVTVDVLENDEKADASTLALVDPDTGVYTSELRVPGEGTWKVTDGRVVFTPEGPSVTDPTPVVYTVNTTEGKKIEASVDVEFYDPPRRPQAVIVPRELPTAFPRPTPEATESVPEPLAFTGSSASSMATVALMLAGIGGFFVVAAARRSDEDETEMDSGSVA